MLDPELPRAEESASSTEGTAPYSPEQYAAAKKEQERQQQEYYNQMYQHYYAQWQQYAAWQRQAAHQTPAPQPSPKTKVNATATSTEHSEDLATADGRAAKQVKDVIASELRQMRERGASLAERKQTFKQLVVRWHPDKNPDQPEIAKRVFQYIQSLKEAFTTSSSTEDLPGSVS
jgi:hypothetical protein